MFQIFGDFVCARVATEPAEVGGVSSCFGTARASSLLVLVVDRED
jgi:hypothetical protein